MNVSAYEGNQPYIFISYAHKDTAKVLPILESLTASGFRVWYDTGIEAGTEWPEFIATKLSGSASVIAFISKAALDSQNCRREINYAISENKEMLSVYLEDVILSPGMKMQLGTTQGIYYFRMQFESFIQNLMSASILSSCCNNSTVSYKVPTVAKQKLASQGLTFELNNDGSAYILTGVGTCTDTDIVIPNEHNGKPVTTIMSEAFTRCRNITSIVIGNRVKIIGSRAFAWCTSLASIEMSDSITTIEEQALVYCNSLKNITLPRSVTSIGDKVFACKNLTIHCETKSKPAGWHENWNFFKCPVVWGDSEPSILEVSTATDDSASKGLSFTLDKKENGYAVTGIGTCTDTDIVIPKTHNNMPVKKIERNAFSRCAKLTSVTIPNSVTVIETFAFINSENLTSVTIPDSVIWICPKAFGLCKKLTIYCEAKTKPEKWYNDWNASNRPVVWGYKG